MGRVSLSVRVTVVGAVLAFAATASAQTHTPPAVTGSSLTQQGRDLVWWVRLARPFSAKTLARQHDSLCLVIERRRGGTREAVCVMRGRHRRPPPRLELNNRIITATVTRPARNTLRAAFPPSAVGLRYTSLRWQTGTFAPGPPCTALCTRLVPTQPKFLALHIPRLVGCVPAGAPYVTHGPAAGREVALTFDDGPWYDTPQFLDVLEREHVVATFFQIGEQIAQYGSVDRRMLRDGDMIGDHTWSHATVSGGGSFAAGQISRAAAAIRGATGGFNPCLFRAPGGAVSPALISEARSMGFTTIEWDVDPRDWATPGTGAIYSNVIANTHAGSIVLQHDGGGNRSQTLAALPREISTLRHEGYHFVTVTQLLGYRLLYK
jgi:peptidoglycan/xylan/chitin deacetylase (PgdA/CDA1 family)